MDKKAFTCRATYSVDNTYDSDRFIKLRVKVCHDGRNANGSVISKETMQTALPTIANTPVLANVVEKEDGTFDFHGHDMAIVEDPMNEGKYRLEYIEVPVGVFPADGLEAEIVEEDGKNYVYASAYVWRGYSNLAEDILKQRESVDVSMEINIDAYEYNEQDGLFYITDFKFTGVTLLGADVTPAMTGAQATTKFSADKNDDKLAKLLFALSEELFNNTRKDGDVTLPKDKKTELPAKEMTVLESSTGEMKEIPAEDNLENPTNEMAQAKTAAEEAPADAMSAETHGEPALFSATYVQKRNALADALPDQVVKTPDGKVASETWYWLQDFDDTYAYVERNVWTPDTGCNSENGRMSYTFDDVAVTAEFNDDFEKMVLKWLTLEEAAKLEEARSVFAEVEELRAYKRTAEADQIFAEFTDLAGNEQFEALKTDNSKFSIDELKRECYVIRGMAHTPTAQFEAEPEAPKIAVKHSADTTASAIYGGIFDKFGITKKTIQED